MPSWIIVLIVLIGAVCAAVIGVVKEKRSGKCSCGHDCSACKCCCGSRTTQTSRK
ncbi:MAG: FeoB-associated Cys-rich membrane protein [Ruminiclostridium sp.]|nr:FeoB-associated Cys-rich membrane protein [Ruminiclostridium sp.]